MDDDQNICVYVAYATPDHQEMVQLELPVNSTVEQAINESSLLQKHSEIDLDKMQVGIYGKIVENTQLLHNQDRIEIYRPLVMDPMHARRIRASI